MAHLTNFSFELFYAIFTHDAPLLFLYHGVKTSKMTKNSNQGCPAWLQLGLTCPMGLEEGGRICSLSLSYSADEFCILVATQ